MVEVDKPGGGVRVSVRVSVVYPARAGEDKTRSCLDQGDRRN